MTINERNQPKKTQAEYLAEARELIASIKSAVYSEVAKENQK